VQPSAALRVYLSKVIFKIANYNLESFTKIRSLNRECYYELGNIRYRRGISMSIFYTTIEDLVTNYEYGRKPSNMIDSDGVVYAAPEVFDVYLGSPSYWASRFDTMLEHVRAVLGYKVYSCNHHSIRNFVCSRVSNVFEACYEASCYNIVFEQNNIVDGVQINRILVRHDVIHFTLFNIDKTYGSFGYYLMRILSDYYGLSDISEFGFRCVSSTSITDKGGFRSGVSTIRIYLEESSEFFGSIPFSTTFRAAFEASLHNLFETPANRHIFKYLYFEEGSADQFFVNTLFDDVGTSLVSDYVKHLKEVSEASDFGKQFRGKYIEFCDSEEVTLYSESYSYSEDEFDNAEELYFEDIENFEFSDSDEDHWPEPDEYVD
jgi:hypothetical protein